MLEVRSGLSSTLVLDLPDQARIIRRIIPRSRRLQGPNPGPCQPLKINLGPSRIDPS